MSSLFDQLSGFQFPDVLMNSGPLPSTAGGPAGSDGSVDGVINGTSALLENISPYAMGESARTGSDRNYQQIPHRFQYIIPKLFLPSFNNSDRRIPVSHAVDQGDIAFILYGTDRAWFTSVEQFRGRVSPCAFATIDVVNYILLCLQASPNEIWEDVAKDLIKHADFKAALKKRRDKKNLDAFDHVLIFKALRMLVQQCFVPHGICAGSEHQGGQHEHDGGQPVQAAVNFVTTMTVDGKNVDLVNYWYETSVIAGDELIFRLEKQTVKTKVFHLTKYYKEPVPMSVDTSQNANGDYGYWQLVPDILREPSGKARRVDKNKLWCDHRIEGYWRIAQTFQTRAQNNSVKAFNQGLPLEVTFSPVWQNFSDCQTRGVFGPSIKVQVEEHDADDKKLTAEVHPKKIIWKYDAKDIFTLGLKKNRYEVTVQPDLCTAHSGSVTLKEKQTFDKGPLSIQFICFEKDQKENGFKFQPLNMSVAVQQGTVNQTSELSGISVQVPIKTSTTKTDGVAFHVKMKIDCDDKAAGFLHEFTYGKMHRLNNNLWHGQTVVQNVTIQFEKSSKQGDVPLRSQSTVSKKSEKSENGSNAGSIAVSIAGGSNGFGNAGGDPDEVFRLDDIPDIENARLTSSFPTAASFGISPAVAAQGPAKKPRKTLRFLSDPATDANAGAPAVSTADSGR